MIISVSRRTDIPSFYSDWFFNRIKEKYVLVPNPFNEKMISKVNLHPDVVDCIVFWTKNPLPMLNKLEKLKDYKYYFQFTLNPYGKDIECNIPSLGKRIEIFKNLSEKIGREKVIWRYDPILINEQYNLNFHKEAFDKIAFELKDYTDKCMLGFIDHYRHIISTLKQFNINRLEMNDIIKMSKSFKQATDKYGLILETCTKKVDLTSYGIESGLCVDKYLIEKIIGYPISIKKDKNQRDICNCVESIDIGTYESCLNNCIYCYAIRGNNNTVLNKMNKHDKNSPLQIGNLQANQIIKEREIKSLRDNQTSLF